MVEAQKTSNGVLLRVRDLKTYFRTAEGIAKAVDGVSFDIHRGEIFALVGESGCGKTVTALSTIQLIQKPAGFIAGGAIEYKGKDIVRIPEIEKRKLRGNEISMIFQEPMTSLNPVFTVGNQIAEVIKRHQGVDSAEARNRAIQMLDMVKIPEPALRFRDYPHQLSGGMKQRVMIAMALACRPGLLIADEPTTALDVTIQEQILALIRDLREEFGTTVLLITHDLGVVAENADRVAVMYGGKIVEEADRKTLFEDPAHPYTVKLLQSLPTRQKQDEALQTIEGRVPRATQFPPGCRFSDRCHRTMDICKTEEPKLISLKNGHQAACLLYDEQIMGRPVFPVEIREAPPKRARAEREAETSPLVAAHGIKLWFPIKRGLFKKTVGYVRAVDGVDLTVRKGRTLALVGESGCGKTTLGKALIQLLRPTGGTVEYGGADLTALSHAALKPYRRKLQIVFQDPFSSLNPRQMVGEILQEGMEAHKIGRTRTERLERAQDLMEQVGLEEKIYSRSKE